MLAIIVVFGLFISEFAYLWLKRVSFNIYAKLSPCFSYFWWHLMFVACKTRAKNCFGFIWFTTRENEAKNCKFWNSDQFILKNTLNSLLLNMKAFVTQKRDYTNLIKNNLSQIFLNSNKPKCYFNKIVFLKPNKITPVIKVE